MLDIKLVEELLIALPWNAARIKCAAILIVSILRNRTVNLTILATEGTTSATNESRYRRFQNFFLKFAMPIDSVGAFNLSKLQIPTLGWVLAMDRTNWKFGKKHINILTVGVVVKKIAFPIAWVALPQKTKRGNSNSKQRIALLKRPRPLNLWVISWIPIPYPGLNSFNPDPYLGRWREWDHVE